MDIKQKVLSAYNDNAGFWHESRKSTPENFNDSYQLKRNRPHLFVEKPAMKKLLSNQTGKRILLLGCGSGEEVDLFLNKGAKSIVGVDLSDKLIEIARNDFPEIEFKVMDAENLEFEDNSFDFVYSSLMLDYFESWDKVLGEVNRVLVKKGVFQFSNIHPIRWGAHTVYSEDRQQKSILLGIEKNEETGEQKIYGDYLNTVLHDETWFHGMEIQYYTKPVSMMINDLINAGFKILRSEEPKTTAEAKELEPLYYESGQKIPTFIIFVCEKE